MSKPATEAGRRLLDTVDVEMAYDELATLIAAIEDEAREQYRGELIAVGIALPPLSAVEYQEAVQFVERLIRGDLVRRIEARVMAIERSTWVSLEAPDLVNRGVVLAAIAEEAAK